MLEKTTIPFARSGLSPALFWDVDLDAFDIQAHPAFIANESRLHKAYLC